jgi:hypothetical protein
VSRVAQSLQPGGSGDRIPVKARYSEPSQTGPEAHPAYCTKGTMSKERPERHADHSPPSSTVVKKEYKYISTPFIGRTACTEPQCLYSTAIPLLPLWTVRPIQSLSACTKVHFTFTLRNWQSEYVAVRVLLLSFSK